ncbi:MAG: response regulator [Desulfarculaceae bacterium]|jgi:DNA-binding NtrC family response regulator
MSDNGIKILLVDDEADFLETLAKRLALRKLTVHTATSGKEALATLEREAVEVVVLDVKMPGMDGITTIKEIKHHHPLVEVIMLTGHADLEASAEGMARGAFDYLLKPVAIDELVYKIQDAHQARSLRVARMEALRTAARNRSG